MGGGIALSDDIELALEAGEIGTWEWDLATDRLRWSAQMSRNLWLPPDAAGDDAYRVLLDAIHVDDQAEMAAALDRFHPRLGPLRIEVRLAYPREPRWIVFLGQTLAGADGSPTRMLGITIDSTRRRRAEEEAAAALLESEQRLRELTERLQARAERSGRALEASRAQIQAIFDNSPDWLTLFRATADGRFIYADLNRATERAYGLAYDEIVGRPVEAILGPEQAELPLQLMRACIATGENQRYTARRVMAGVTRTIDVMFVRVPEQRDGDDFIMATARDLTEREAIEEQLRHAQKMEAIGQLTGGLAHDFNNLLTAVLGNLELLQRQLAGDAAAQNRIMAAMRSAENGAKLTQQLLAFARRQHLQPRATDLNDVLTGMSELLSRTLGGTIRLETRLQRDLWPALVDQAQIEVSILNLALNARDAMSDGGTLSIETRNQQQAQHSLPEMAAADCVCVTVRDSGTGMSEETLKSAIEPFFTTKEPGRGSGLGLSQVYGVVQQSNGAMRIESRPGEGTAIRLFLPRAGKPEDLPQRDEAARPATPPHTAILVVDDDDGVRDIVADMLGESGYAITVAPSGHVALDLLAHHMAVDLLLIDVAMPELTGIETVRRARMVRPDLRVLYMTGYADFAARGQTDTVPMIRKPFRQHELLAAIDAALTAPSGTGAVLSNRPIR
jgi:PAS domain S-box-containing protein